MCLAQCWGFRPFIRIRILLFTLIRIRLFNLIRIRLFDTDPDPCRFKEVMYIKRYFLYIFTWFSLSVSPTGPTQREFFIKFFLPVNFVVLTREYGTYGSGSWKFIRIHIRNTGLAEVGWGSIRTETGSWRRCWWELTLLLPSFWTVRRAEGSPQLQLAQRKPIRTLSLSDQLRILLFRKKTFPKFLYL